MSTQCVNMGKNLKGKMLFLKERKSFSKYLI